MKIKNKGNGVLAEVPDSLGELLVKAGSWELVEDEAPVVVKAVRKRAPKKAVAETEA